MKYPTTEDIISTALRVYGLTFDEFRQSNARGGKGGVVRPRQTVQWMCYRMGTDTLGMIASKTGVLNHATVLYSYRLIESQAPMYGEVADYVRMLDVGLYYLAFETVNIELAPPVDWYDPDNRPTQERVYRRIPVKITDNNTDVVTVVPSKTEASRLTGISRKSLLPKQWMDRRTVKNFTFEYYV